jgi:hypothetical protein
VATGRDEQVPFPVAEAVEDDDKVGVAPDHELGAVAMAGERAWDATFGRRREPRFLQRDGSKC